MSIKDLRWLVFLMSFAIVLTSLDNILDIYHIAIGIYSVLVLIVIGYDLIVRGEEWKKGYGILRLIVLKKLFDCLEEKYKREVNNESLQRSI